jgi:hypothetical protein
MRTHVHAGSGIRTHDFIARTVKTHAVILRGHLPLNLFKNIILMKKTGVVFSGLEKCCNFSPPLASTYTEWLLNIHVNIMNYTNTNRKVNFPDLHSSVSWTMKPFSLIFFSRLPSRVGAKVSNVVQYIKECTLSFVSSLGSHKAHCLVSTVLIMLHQRDERTNSCVLVMISENNFEPIPVAARSKA